jgi:hypothetical protein
MSTTPLVPSARHIVVIDIENIAGGSSPSAFEIEQCKEELRQVLPDFDRTQIIVASSHHAGSEVMFAFPSALRRLNSGPDGADLALLEELEDLRVMCRYRSVTVCSGDGIFADAVAALAHIGVEVTVIAREGSLSARLELAAQRVVVLPGPIPAEPAMAVGRAG